LMKTGRIEQNSLMLGASRYRVVVLPSVERSPLETMRKLEEFARAGGIVIATNRLPEIAPGFKTTAEEQRELHDIVRLSLEGSSTKAKFVADEKQEFAQRLASALQPDMALNGPVPEIGFVHRHLTDAEVYFVANTSNLTQKINATFRVTQKQFESWDPFSGKVA